MLALRVEFEMFNECSSVEQEEGPMVLYSSSMFATTRTSFASSYYEWAVTYRRVYEMAADGNVEACRALSLMSAARESGFYTETSCRVSRYGKTFVLAVYDREGGKLLASFHCSDGIETLHSLYAEELLPEPSTWRSYFRRMLDWVTSPAVKL